MQLRGGTSSKKRKANAVASSRQRPTSHTPLADPPTAHWSLNDPLQGQEDNERVLSTLEAPNLMPCTNGGSIDPLGATDACRKHRIWSYLRCLGNGHPEDLRGRGSTHPSTFSASVARMHRFSVRAWSCSSTSCQECSEPPKNAVRAWQMEDRIVEDQVLGSRRGDWLPWVQGRPVRSAWPASGRCHPLDILPPHDGNG